MDNDNILQFYLNKEQGLKAKSIPSGAFDTARANQSEPAV